MPRTTRKVQIRFFHKNEEPPLMMYRHPRPLPDPSASSHPNELGWQDTITVTVNYDLALLPGPGRLLARYVVGPSGGTVPKPSPITARTTAIR